MSLPAAFDARHDWSWAFGPSVGCKDEFREIPGRPGYRVARDGRVSHDMVPFSASGYPAVYVSEDRRTRLVHWLVLETYVGPRPPGSHGCHNDGNKANASVDNLRWDTPLANQHDKFRHGTMTGKLTEADIVPICEAYKAGHQLKGIGLTYGVSASAIQSVVAGKTWKHVPRDPATLRGKGNSGKRHASQSADQRPSLGRREEDDQGTRSPDGP